MKPKKCKYLVDACNLSSVERAKVKELLGISCDEFFSIVSKPHKFIAYLACSSDEFLALPFPDGCTLTDITGKSSLDYC